MYSSYQAGVSPESGLEVGQTPSFSLEALCAQTNLFWREMKINNMYTKSNTRQEDFRTVARHNRCSFVQVREEGGSPV